MIKKKHQWLFFLLAFPAIPIIVKTIIYILYKPVSLSLTGEPILDMSGIAFSMVVLSLYLLKIVLKIKPVMDNTDSEKQLRGQTIPYIFSSALYLVVFSIAFMTYEFMKYCFGYGMYKFSYLLINIVFAFCVVAFVKCARNFHIEFNHEFEW
jgi:hypothetical protein